MKTSLQSLFNKVGSFKSGDPLWTEEELRALIESSDTPSPFPHKPTSKRWKIMIPGILILAAGATAYFMQTSTAPRTVDSTNQPHAISQSVENSTVKNDTTTTPQVAQNERSATETVLIPTPSQIEGIHALELTRDELQTLGITATDTGYSLTAKLGVEYANPSSLMAFMSNQPNQRVEMKFNPKNIQTVIEKLGGQQASDGYGELTLAVQLDLYTMQSKVVSAGTTPSALYPLVITHQSVDPSGVRKSQAHFFGSAQDAENVPQEFHKEIAGLFDLYSDAPAEKKLLSKFPLISKLIPVRVTLGDKTKSGAAEIIYWFYPSPKFIAQLPERFQGQIQQEVTSIENKENPKLPIEPVKIEEPLAPRETGGYTYTEVARAQSGAISISAIGPNPARERATIFYSLSAPRSVSVALYDFSGRFIATLATADRISAGSQHEISVNVGQLSSGMYLVTMQTDRGEQAIQRLIIEN
jgi:hypothetical protein